MGTPCFQLLAALASCLSWSFPCESAAFLFCLMEILAKTGHFL